MKEMIGTILRLLLKTAGGFIIAKGLADEGTVETISGAALAIFGAIWGVLEAKKAAQNRQSSSPPIGVWLMFALGFALTLTGCATQRPPNAFEQRAFEIKTNVIEVVAWKTNVIVATATAPAAVIVAPVTNHVEQYDFVPSAPAKTIVATTAAVTSVWNPIAGGVVGAVLTAVLSLWALVRNRKAATANQLTAAELTQIIETGRQLLLLVPDGAKYEAAWKAWMVKHQAETGVLSTVAQLVADSVDNDKAKGAAQTLVNLIQAQPKA